MTEYFGFIGLGSMGLPMTRVLAEAGHNMWVYDVETRSSPWTSQPISLSMRSQGVKLAD